MNIQDIFDMGSKYYGIYPFFYADNKLDGFQEPINVRLLNRASCCSLQMVLL